MAMLVYRRVIPKAKIIILYHKPLSCLKKKEEVLDKVVYQPPNKKYSFIIRFRCILNNREWANLATAHDPQRE